MPLLEPTYPDAKSPTAYQDGLEFQDFVCDVLSQHGVIIQNFGSKKFQWNKGENRQSWEIKLDKRCTETGRMSIEVAEKSSRDVSCWTKSGIFSKVNSWLYIQGNYEFLAIFSTRWLRRYHDEIKPEIHEKRGTIKTFYLPLETVKNYAEKVIVLVPA